MGAEAKAAELGLTFPEQEPGYLNLCVRTGNLLITSGHTSDIKGKLGADLTVERGYEAAKECAIKILQSVHHAHGTLDGLRVLKLLGCVNSTQDFIEQHLVVNGASDLLQRTLRQRWRRLSRAECARICVVADRACGRSRSDL